jgi:hypothetical protein
VLFGILGDGWQSRRRLGLEEGLARSLLAKLRIFYSAETTT